MAFDPDSYLAGPPSKEFNPDEYLAASSAPVITPEIESRFPYPEKPAQRSITGGKGRGLSGRSSAYEDEKKRIDSIRSLALTNPEQADVIFSEESPFLVGVGAGLTDVSKGLENILPSIPGVVMAPSKGEYTDQTGIKELEQTTPSASAGRIIGQAAPFLPAAVATGALPTLGGRILGSSLVGGTEGAAISSGTGQNPLAGAILGAAVGGGGEVIGAGLNRVAAPLVQKWFGSGARAVDETGNPTPELQYAAQKEGVSIDDLVKQVEDPRQFAQEAITSGQMGAYENIAKGVQVDPKKLAAAKSLGIETDQIPVAALSNQQKVQELAGALAANPASVASEELKNYSKILSQKADDLIVQMGGEIDKAQANEAVKSTLLDIIDKTKSAETEIYNRINEQVGNPIVNAKPLLKDILAAGSKSSAGVKGLSEIERKVYQRLQGKPTYFDLDNLRKEIGAAIGGDTDAFKNTSSAKLNEMYSKVTQLQEGVANQVGDAAGLWSEAKDLARKRFELQDSMKVAFNKDLGGSIIPKVEQALMQTSKGDVSKLRKALDGLPPDMQNKVMATALNRAFTSTGGVDRGFTATNLATFGENLKRSPTAQNLLKSYLPKDGYKSLEAMIDLSQGLASVERKITRTGIVPDELKNFQNTGKIVSALYKAADVADSVPFIGGAFSRPTRLAGAGIERSGPQKLEAQEAADRLLSSPQFKSAVLAHAEGNDKKIAYLDDKLKKSDAYKKYIRSLPKSNVASISSMGLIPFLAKEEEEQ